MNQKLRDIHTSLPPGSRSVSPPLARLGHALRLFVLPTLMGLGCADVPADLDAPREPLEMPHGAEDLGPQGAETDGRDILDALDDAFDPSEATRKAREPAYCGQRWRMSRSTSASGNAQHVAYESAGSRCSGGPTAGARQLGDSIRAHFDHLMNLSVPGRGVQIYACRSVRGGGSLSQHAAGRAVDIFIPTLRGGTANNEQGDVVAAWVVENAERIGVQAVIWDRTWWKASGGSPRDRCYTGGHAHHDHIHIELNRAAGRAETPFFGQADEAPRADNPHEGDDAPELAEPPPPDLWIGDPCVRDEDCNYTHRGARGRCYVEHRPVRGQGFCSLECSGYCPDRSGHAPTFCVSSEALGGLRQGGMCAVKASAINDRCRAMTGYAEIQASRHVGASGVRAARANVCVPEEAMGVVNSNSNSNPNPNPNPNPQPRDDPACAYDGWRCDDSQTGRTRCAYGMVTATEACTHGCVDRAGNADDECGAPPSSGTCENTCRWSGDGECDDGGPGSVYAVCGYGSDCADCGGRR